MLITLAGWSATGADLVLPLGYAVTIVFFALVFPPRSQVVYLVALLASYGAVQLSTDVDLLSFAMLAVLGVLACFLSREVRRRIALHEHARVDAERRWSVVGAVATTARDAEASDPVAVLQSIVDAVALLGYGSAAIHIADGAGRARVFLPSDIDGDSAAAVRRSPIRSDGCPGGGTRGRLHVLGRRSTHAPGTLRVGARGARRRPDRGGIPSVRCPPGRERRPGRDHATGDGRVLDARGPSRPRGRARAAQAEEREVVERLAAADRARADVVGQLSQEIRKPLAIVTETTRALQDADEEAKARLFERLTAGTTALDVTLGGLLDVSLLDAEDMPLEIGDVDLGGLVTGAAERLSGLFVDRAPAPGTRRLHGRSGPSAARARSRACSRRRRPRRRRAGPSRSPSRAPRGGRR